MVNVPPPFIPGAFVGAKHHFRARVYFEDTDLSGIVYHANYLRYMERGRTEFFRTAGISRANLDDAEPSAWALRRIAVEYHRPARLDDQIAVHSVLTGLSGARINVVQKIFCGEMLLVEGRIEACMITLTGKLCRLPKNVLETLAPYVTAEET